MVRKLDNWVKSYLKYTRNFEAPTICHKWTAVSTIAGALRKRVWIDEKSFKWYPNFYILLVAPAGIIAKSTTVDLGMNLLRELDYIKFGPASAPWQAFLEEMTESCEAVLFPDGSYYPMSAITVVASELGTFFDPNDREKVDTLVDLWDGKDRPYRRRTRSHGNELVPNPWVNVIGCTTPAWISENFSQHFLGAGLASRMLVVYQDRKQKLIAYPHKTYNGTDLKLREDLIHDLREISNMLGEFKLTLEAEEWGEEWYKEHFRGYEDKIEYERFQGYLARKQTHIHKLAIVLSAAESDELIIHKHHLQLADKEVTALEERMTDAFSVMEIEKEVRLITDIHALLKKKNGRATEKELFSPLMKIASYDTFAKAIKSLLASGKVALKVEQGTNIPYFVLQEKERPNV